MGISPRTSKAHSVTTPSLHAEIIGALSPRSWLVGGSLISNRWVIRTDDADISRTSPQIFDFGVLLTGWPTFQALSDAIFEADLITAKLLVYNCLEPPPVGWCSSGSSALHLYKRYLIFLRWRIDRGLASNAELSAAWHRDFVTSLRADGREGLLRLERRAEQIVKAVDAGRLQLPHTRISENLTVVRVPEIAKLLGLSFTNQITSAAIDVLEPFVLSRNMQFRRQNMLRQNERIKEQTATSLLAPWFHLWRLRGVMSHDPIGYKAYSSSREIGRSIKDWAEAPERTKDAPPYQTSWLINSALTLILDDVSGDIVSLAYYIGQAENNFESIDLLISKINSDLLRLGFPPSLNKYVARASEMLASEATDIRNLIFVLLPAACAIVIATWSARRHKELDSLKEDCIEIDADGEVWLHCLIVKNLRAKDRIPVPRSVKIAVELLKSLRASTNSYSDPAWLFDFTCPVSQRHVHFEMAEALSRFAMWVKVPPLTDGSFWVFTPQQFRKFFGIAYHWRYLFPNFVALSHHYRHNNPDTTRGYIGMKANDALRLHEERSAANPKGSLDRVIALSELERQRDIEHSRIRFVEEMIRSAALGERQLAGYGGKALMAELNRLVAELEQQTLLSSADDPDESFNAMIATFAKGKALQSHPEGHSLCKCGSDKSDLSVAKCLELKSIIEGAPPEAAIGPDYAYTEDEICLACPHNVQVEELTTQWDRAEDATITALEHASPDQREVLLKRQEKIQKFRSELPWAAKE